MKPLLRNSLLGGGLILGLALSGCAMSASQAQYLAHTSHRIAPGGEPDPELALAFGLDPHTGDRPVAIVRVNP